MKRWWILLVLCMAGGTAAAEVRVSELDPAKEKKRESRFDKWLPKEEFMAKIRKYNSRGDFVPVYIEEKGDERYRMILVRATERLGWSYYIHSQAESLTRHDLGFDSAGKTMISCSKFVSVNKDDPEKSKTYYCAVWVENEKLGLALKLLKRYGIGVGSTR